MFSKWMKKASLIVLGGVAALATGATAQAGSLQLGNSGWTASWATFRDPYLALNVDFESTDSVYIEKKMNFQPSDVDASGLFINPVVIVFQQTSANALPFIVINDEQLINNTGVTWNGFKFTILGGTPGATFDAGRTDVSPPGAGFSLDPFTNGTYSQGDTILTVGQGGNIPDGGVWFPGAQSGGLAISALPMSDLSGAFTLKEQPLIGGVPNVIPLPAAAWSGLTGLAGLALVATRKHLGRLFA